MTLLGKMKLGFRAVVVAVAILMALNFGELLWINYWQNDTKRAVDDSQAAGQVTLAVERMAANVSGLASALFEGEVSGQQNESFTAQGAKATAALDSILSSKKPGSAEAAAVESLSSQFDEFVQAGNTLLASTDVDMTNVLTRTGPVSAMASEVLNASREFQSSSETAIATKLDRLGLVGTICLIITAVLGFAAVVGGALLSWVLPRRMGLTLGEAAAGISSSAAELMSVASQVAASAAQTAASTNETTVTVEEVKQTAVLAHEKASQAAEGAQGAVHVAGSARLLAEETVSGIERMQSEMDVVFETINRLSEQTQAAGDIIGSVNDLAEQSNLLSVNASIEASKAGDYGKGFTVVAQEVKSLAEQSKQAVAQVRTMLSEIQKASQMAVQAAARGREAVEAGRQQSIDAGEVMQTLANGASEDAQSSMQIAASSQQQLAGMEQIAQAIQSINEAGNQSVAGTRQVEREVRHLQDMALGLRKLVQAKGTEE